MEYSQLGSSSLNISIIGFGCMSLQPGDAAAADLLHAAIDKGINFFDTADLYNKGENEALLGRALKEKRKDILIATKVGNQWKQDGSGWVWNPRKAYIMTAVDESLRRLQTDYIDLYQLHGGTLEDNIDETLEAFTSLQQQGKIRYFGISSIRPNVIRAYAYRSKLTSVMMQYSLLDRRPEETCLPLLQDKNIGVLARGTVAGGLLAGKPSAGYLNYSSEEVARAANAIRAASTEGRTASQTAIRFVLQQPAITAAIVGIRTMEQLLEAVGTLEKPMLKDVQYQQLQEALTPNYYTAHR
ncbi:MAG TPA: aldo/keto reductase [Chitinophagaceae bacterium]|nr:aldo/keto reductase [Chitinophagaceae bacterium]